jgi:glycosyltransferase involved in cell wall biosynthesis
MMPEVSLILCTRNRSAALKHCLQAVASAGRTGVQAELVVVDNGSTDNTQEVIDRFVENSSIPVIRVFEPALGLSNARNAGLAAAQGHILAFTDDDCYVAVDYFISLRNAYRQAGFEYSGGRILLHDPTDVFYACNDKDAFESIPPRSYIPAGKIQGANMAITRRLFEVVGRFDPHLGAGTRFRCEDVDYIARASAAGFTGAHLPEVVVYHHHRRKAGTDLDKLIVDNHYARGAYHTKRLMAGDLPALYHWARVLWAEHRNCRLGAELRGGWSYVHSRLARRQRDTGSSGGYGQC